MEALFGISPGFFNGARIYWGNAGTDEEQDEELHQILQADDEQEEQDEQDAIRMNKWTCGTCKMKFETGLDQRSHYKSDFHRLNLKRKVAGKSCLTEEEFERFAAGAMDDESGVSSISGSDSDSDSDENRRRTRSKLGNKVPFLLSSGSIAQVWRCVLLSDKEKLQQRDSTAAAEEEPSSTVTEQELLQRLNALTEPVPDKVLWVVLLAVGGHFAGVVVEMRKNLVQAHQTYHRYVVRAKAGGKQSSRDATGRAPKSAGASLRRYNELALQKEIKGLLDSWRDYLRDAACIFMYAPSRNSQSLFGDKSLLDRNDPRVRSIPFATKRPTYKETKRVYGLLASIFLRTKEELEPTREQIPEVPPQVLELKLDDKTPEKDGRFQDEDSRTAAEKTFAEEVRGSWTPLHQASTAGQAALVTKLLEEGADPCVRDQRGRTPYTVAPDKETRNAFRKFMGLHLDLWDWHAANVPSALTDEMEAAQAAKQAEKNAKRKAKEKQRRKEKKAQEKAEEVKAKAEADAKAEEPKNSVARERELRAAAAESRMKASLLVPLSSTSGEVCSCCGTSLANKVPFSKFSYKYCSVSCVNAHRRLLEADS